MAQKNYQNLIQQGFERVERDDRLLDIFPAETSEKGIELWDRWNTDTVDIVRTHLQKQDKAVQSYTFPRTQIEEALMSNSELLLK